MRCRDSWRYAARLPLPSASFADLPRLAYAISTSQIPTNDQSVLRSPRFSMAQSVERMKIDSENVPLTALAGRTPGRTPNKRATMGGPTFVPPPRMGSSPPSSPLANRSNVDDVTWAAQGARSGYPAQPHHDRRVGSADMAPPPPVTRHDRRQTMAPNMMSAYRLKEEEEEPALMAAPMPPPGGADYRWNCDG